MSDIIYKLDSWIEAWIGAQSADREKVAVPMPSGLDTEVTQAIRRAQRAKRIIIAPNVAKMVTIGGDTGAMVRMPHKKNTPDVHLQRGRDFKDDGDLKRSITEFREAIKLKPKNESATFLLAFQLSQRWALEHDPQDIVEAINLYLELLHRDILHEQVWCNLAIIMQRIGAFEIASHMAHTSLKLDPSDELAQNVLSTL